MFFPLVVVNYQEFAPLAEPPLGYEQSVLYPLRDAQEKAAQKAIQDVLEAAQREQKRKDDEQAAKQAKAAEIAYTQAVATYSGDVKAIIVKWANYYGVDANWLLRIADCESGYNPQAEAPNLIDGTHPTGLFQHVARYWPSRAAAYGVPGASIFDPEAQARVTAGMFHDGQSGQWECR